MRDYTFFIFISRFKQTAPPRVWSWCWGGAAMSPPPGEGRGLHPTQLEHLGHGDGDHHCDCGQKDPSARSPSNLAAYRLSKLLHPGRGRMPTKQQRDLS